MPLDKFSAHVLKQELVQKFNQNHGEDGKFSTQAIHEEKMKALREGTKQLRQVAGEYRAIRQQAEKITASLTSRKTSLRNKAKKVEGLDYYAFGV